MAHDADNLERSLGRGLPPRSALLYRALAAEIDREAREHSVPILSVDGPLAPTRPWPRSSRSSPRQPAAGPRADSLDERHALLREATLAHVGQLRRYYARPWAEGDAEAVVRRFVCKCGDRAYVASVELTVGAASTEPVLAAGDG